jgi:transmembrane sensor
MESVVFVEHYVLAGKRDQIILPDGSFIWLNSGTLLVHPSSFTSSKR